MGRIKLIQLGKYYYPVPGGMETHLYDTCNQLKHKYDVEVLVANTQPRTVVQYVAGVRVQRMANLGEVFSSPICPTLPNHLVKSNGNPAGLIQLHLPNPMAHISYLLARPQGRLIVTWHSDIIKQKWLSKVYRTQLYHLLERADCIVATSPNYINHSPFLNKYEHKCAVVPLGIRVEKFRASYEVNRKASLIRQRYDRPIILFVGRLTYYKGLDVLLESADRIPAKFLLIGTGPLQQKVQRLVDQNGLADKIFLLHNVTDDDLVSYYHACDLAVLPSNERSEAFGIVQLEAMTCGKPVVSTNLTTGVPWVNRHGETGLVVPVNDPAKLAEAINYLLKNERERIRLGENGQRRVERHFTLEKVTQKLEQVYHQVLNGGMRYNDVPEMNKTIAS
ncbi:glycosyltransferase [candidate division KSB1 bacterium]|nr:glycosyltransferase [candidate division KSB1 bacterium]NIR72883.1 glycosyltransferase [candidate division KSB1 bacterium]NIS25270.1 glycosyltransferase [candidate division KSB1 bacterium]NIT72174.1 glycosyltransferase [candidate division KSB1 bacterium]NIU25979.1 glycosyltransferase [candidate division KSB1 bacterium]